MRFTEIDGCPVPVELVGEVLAIKRATGARLNSCYRGDDKDAQAILKANGKSTQRELYDGYRQGKPGYNPANPPGRSTHECRSDGVAYPGPLGRRLRGWQCGMDWDDSDEALSAARKLGLRLIRPYADGRERHHLNFTREPKINWLPALKHGSRGVRVRNTTAKLRTTGHLKVKLEKPWLYSTPVVEAVKSFQRAHGLMVDGVAGWHTLKVLTAAARAVKQRAKPKPAPKPAAKLKPKSSRLRGVDVSMHQGDIDWRKVKADGMTFAVCKATEGGDYVDPTFTAQRVRAVRSAGLVLGTYHYLRPRKGRSGAAEARHYVSTVKRLGGFRPGDLVPVVDIEESALGHLDTIRYIGEFVNEIRRLTGRRPIIYTGSFWRDHLAGQGENHGCSLWLAAYVKDPDPYIPKPWTRWVFWQHTSKGRVDGISGNVDLNVFVGTLNTYRL